MIRFTKLDTAPKQYMLDDIVELIPSFLSHDDPRKAKEQIHEAYSFGGGWRPIAKFAMRPDASLKYPGDPVLKPWAHAKLRNENIYVYQSGFVAIIQLDGSFEVSRLD